MNCMKCGREIPEENVFCQDCLLTMEKYPVQPGTVVLLPRRRESSIIKKAPKRHVPSAEERIAVYRKWIRIQMIALLVCILLIILMFNPTLHYILNDHFEIGQNYSTVTQPVSSNPSTAEKP